MKEYRGDEILKLIVHRLVCRTQEYGAFLNMKAEEILDKLRPKLEELRELKNKSKSGPHGYFLDELGYYKFLMELSLVEALNAYSRLTKEGKKIPSVIEDENMDVMDTTHLWEKWIEQCKAQQ